MPRVQFWVGGLVSCILLYSLGILTYRSCVMEVHLQQPNSLSLVETTMTEMPVNYTINEMWRTRFLEGGFTRIHISDECGFAYFTTLKTASMTTRHLIDQDECGFGSRSRYPITSSHWKSCNEHKCGEDDFAKFESPSLLNIIFVRNPLSRFESLYNFVGGTSVRVPVEYRFLFI